MRVTSLSGLCLDNGVDRKGIPFLTLPCLRLLIFCFGFDVTVDYQYLLLWAIGPCCLQFFKSVLPEISTSPVLHDLLRSFQAEAPIREVRPPSWDLNIVSFFFTILVFSAVDNYFITGFDPQDVVFAFVGYRKEGG